MPTAGSSPARPGLSVLATLPALAIDANRRPRPPWLALWASPRGGALFWHMRRTCAASRRWRCWRCSASVALARLLDRRLFAAAVVLLVGIDAADADHQLSLPRQRLDAAIARRRDRAHRAHHAPRRALLERVMARDPDACVLMSDPKAPFVGAGHGQPCDFAAPPLRPELWRARATRRKRMPVAENGARVAVADQNTHVLVDPAEEPLLADVLAADGYAMQVQDEGAGSMGVAGWIDLQQPAAATSFAE